MRRIFISSSLRFKILFALMLSIIPMLAVAVIAYRSASESTLVSSSRIMKLTGMHGAKEINQFVEAQKGVFIDWTKEDTFGMAIEFDTTNELRNQLASLLKGQEGFCLLLLTDMDGKVLQAAVGENEKKVSSEKIIGQKVKEMPKSTGQAGRVADLIESDFMKELGIEPPTTIRFTFQTKDSDKKSNGYLIGYLRWSAIQNKSKSVADEMKRYGFDDGRLAIVDTSSGRMMARSDRKNMDSQLKMDDALKAWMNSAKSAETQRFILGKEADYVSVFPVASMAGPFGGTQTGQSDSHLLLTMFVSEKSILSSLRVILWTSLIIACVSTLLIVLAGFLIVRLISRSLNQVIDGLSESAEHVSSASTEIATASRHLSEGTSQQAAAIEQTAASLEETAAMTRRNAGNASEASKLMADTAVVVDEAGAFMTELTVSMSEISKSSDETQRIVKEIDAIAFQTNLLALNAAVEAARAGEAGAGFAVVAEEVRNLAKRAADAARNTADLIEGSAQKINHGSDIGSRANDAFVRVAEHARKVGELVAEIAVASNEQAQGIKEINLAVVSMDKVTQQNAAIAEESASSTLGMHSRADQMKGFVAQLVTLVSGNGKKSEPVHSMELIQREPRQELSR
ncbi:MAG: methyl-accepting chemotaxis protein [Syntrophobacteraceae bacterium]